jgi:hypothetical protein
MLRVDNRMQTVKFGWSFPGMFIGRYGVQAGKRDYGVRWKRLGANAEGA